MKLYFSKGACSLSIRIIAHELGIKLDYESVDLASKKTASGADYWAINSKGSVPALVLDDGSVLTENIAIALYLADTHPSPLLPGLGQMERYRVLEWESFMASDLHKSFTPLFHPRVPQDLKDSLFIPMLKSKLKILNKALSENQFLTGNTFTLPDAYCFVVLRWLKHFNIELDEFTDLHRYFLEIEKRTAVQAALSEE